MSSLINIYGNISKQLFSFLLYKRADCYFITKRKGKKQANDYNIPWYEGVNYLSFLLSNSNIRREMLVF